jgi:nucleoside-diphosphate-sugar epimerase
LEALKFAPGNTLSWDILEDVPPKLPVGINCMIVLAGVMGNDAVRLQDNTKIALAAATLAQEMKISRVLVASTQAVYGAPDHAVKETHPCMPSTAYGNAKLDMERALSDFPEVTCLRFGNVAGTDTLCRAATRQRVVLDQFEDGKGPYRSYIGPITLAQTLIRLLDPKLPLPKAINIANPGVVAMDDLLSAAGVCFDVKPVQGHKLRSLEMDVAQLCALVPLKRTTAQSLADEALYAGWRPITNT